MADQIVRVLAKDAPVKASAISARALVERARQIHKTLPVATAALGRALMGGGLNFPRQEGDCQPVEFYLKEV